MFILVLNTIFYDLNKINICSFKKFTYRTKKIHISLNKIILLVFVKYYFGLLV